jgi:hypothetical protein
VPPGQRVLSRPGPSTQHRSHTTAIGRARGHPPPGESQPRPRPQQPSGPAPTPAGTRRALGLHKSEADPGTTCLGGPKNEITEVSAGDGKFAQRILLTAMTAAMVSRRAEAGHLPRAGVLGRATAAHRAGLPRESRLAARTPRYPAWAGGGPSNAARPQRRATNKAHPGDRPSRRQWPPARNRS